MTNIPEGWKLVPADPTPEMVRAGQRAVGHADQGSSFTGAVGSPYAYGCCYRAMLAAAPPPALEVERLNNYDTANALTNGHASPDWTMDDVRAARSIESACAAAWGVTLKEPK